MGTALRLLSAQTDHPPSADPGRPLCPSQRALYKHTYIRNTCIHNCAGRERGRIVWGRQRGRSRSAPVLHLRRTNLLPICPSGTPLTSEQPEDRGRRVPTDYCNPRYHGGATKAPASQRRYRNGPWSECITDTDLGRCLVNNRHQYLQP